ncbi:hypothetical protein FQA39_LY14437 [Lamprigera yunnana]|nr:hypothetical protein FQA39_LY14437 [Lamprigera yunnana]
MSQFINTLVEMGFSRPRAELAVQETKGEGLQQATEWLLSNEEEPKVPVVASAPLDQSDANDSIEEKANTEKQEKQAKSIKCDDCGKLLASELEVQFHAAKTKHENFSESTEEKKPLTEEEKKEQLAKIEAKLKQRRLEREAREKAEELEKEKGRIRSGKDLLEAKRKQDDTETKKMLEQKKREKQEEKLAKERVKLQIEQDKEERKLLFGQKTEEVPKSLTPTPPPVKLAVNYSEAKLSIRLPDSTMLFQTFGAKEPLSAVRLYIEINRTDESGPFQLRTQYPAKTFRAEDYDKPLECLELVPTAVLIVVKTM